MTIDFKQDILAPVATDFAAMDTLINEGISSKVALVMSVSKHVVEAGGKRMRPIMQNRNAIFLKQSYRKNQTKKFATNFLFHRAR